MVAVAKIEGACFQFDFVPDFAQYEVNFQATMASAIIHGCCVEVRVTPRFLLCGDEYVNVRIDIASLDVRLRGLHILNLLCELLGTDGSTVRAREKKNENVTAGVTFQKFVAHSRLVKDPAGLLADDRVLRFRVTLTTTPLVRLNETFGPPPRVAPCRSAERLKLLTDHVHADVCFEFPNAERLWAHSAVLGLTSSAFREYLASNDAENGVWLVPVNGDKLLFQEFVSFFYTGFESAWATGGVTNSLQLLILATRYTFPEMVKKLESSIRGRMDPSACFAVLAVASDLGATCLTEMALEFFNSYADELMDTPEAEAFFQSRPLLATKVHRLQWAEKNVKPAREKRRNISM
jgi:hypothetical protein